ncbi:PqqD family protein [Paenibacillus hodogayensis]|uniref:PqqD family protein n=1 Tax=Paenibacillus hodogayensis TaxID=279208 RepID=A0ABV5VP77_9BACL
MKVTAQSRLTPVQLVIRPDRQGYIVEDAAAGDYYEMNELCVRALQRMQEGAAIGEIEAELRERFPREDVDVIGFADQLQEMGLVAELDGVALRRDEGPAQGGVGAGRPAGDRQGGFAWIPASFARFWFHPLLLLLYGCAIAANAAILIVRPDLFPRYGDVFLFDSMVLNSVVWLGLSFVLLMLHELGHIMAVRSFGLPARLGIGHRFVFVVFETEMDGIWRLTPKQRNVAFLAGMGVDQLVLLLCLALQAAFPEQSGLIGGLAALAALDVFVKLAFQCCFYMKTDLYYVAENVTGCYNLMERSRDWLAGKLWKGRSAQKQPEETRAVRWYALFYAAGYVFSVTLIAVFFAPQLIVSVTTIVPWLAEPQQPARFWDAVVFLVELLGLGGLLAYAWSKNRKSAGAEKKDRSAAR